MKHTIIPDINNPSWRYVPSTETSIQRRFEDSGYVYKDKVVGKSYDFKGLHYWMWLITHKEQPNAKE